MKTYMSGTPGAFEALMRETPNMDHRDDGCDGRFPECRHCRYHLPYLNELKEKALTDPEAAEELAKIREAGRESSARSRAKREERMATDPEYAEFIHRREQDYERRHSEKRKQKRQDLIRRAETDPEAARELEELRAHHRDLARARRAKIRAEKVATEGSGTL